MNIEVLKSLITQWRNSATGLKKNGQRKVPREQAVKFLSQAGIYRICASELEASLGLPRDGLNIWTVYDHPLDYPNSFVARRWAMNVPTADVIVSPSLDRVRASLPPGLYRMNRNPNDDPKIVEVWI
jgi:hypothetical protein